MIVNTRFDTSGNWLSLRYVMASSSETAWAVVSVPPPLPVIVNVSLVVLKSISYTTLLITTSTSVAAVSRAKSCEPNRRNSLLPSGAFAPRAIVTCASGSLSVSVTVVSISAMFTAPASSTNEATKLGSAPALLLSSKLTTGAALAAWMVNVVPPVAFELANASFDPFQFEAVAIAASRSAAVPVVVPVYTTLSNSSDAPELAPAATAFTVSVRPTGRFDCDVEFELDDAVQLVVAPDTEKMAVKSLVVKFSVSDGLSVD